MKIPKTLPKYTVDQISEIRNRIATLRMRWLCSVEARLAPQKSETPTLLAPETQTLPTKSETTTPLTKNG
jgi:hypothetical protein